MALAGAILAYRDSLLDAAVYDTEYRIGVRSTPFIGGILPSVKKMANVLWRPFKVLGGLLLGRGEEREFPKMPAIPDNFKGTQLEKTFKESWRIELEEVKGRVEAITNLLHLDIPGWWQAENLVQYNESREYNVLFPDEGRQRDAKERDTAIDQAIAKAEARNGGSFVKAVEQSRGEGAERSPS